MTDYTKLVEDLRDIEKTMFALGTSPINMDNVSIRLAYDKRWGATANDAAAAIEDLQAGMKTYGDTAFNEGYEMGFAAGEARAENRIEPKQGEIVRCGECKHHEDEEPGMVYCPKIVGSWVSENWYCADGEREVQDA